MEKREPSPRALDQVRISDLLVRRALMVHRLLYGLSAAMGVMCASDGLIRSMGAEDRVGERYAEE